MPPNPLPSPAEREELADWRARLVAIDYTNHRGERAERLIRPTGDFEWGSSLYHPEPQWLLWAWDHEKRAARQFAMRDIHAWRTATMEEVARVSAITEAPE